MPVAESRVAEFDLAEALSEQTVEAYARDGRLRVVDEESADALLELVVLNIEDRPFTYTASEQTEQYRFLLSVRGRLVRSLDEEVLIDFAPIEGWATYERCPCGGARSGCRKSARWWLKSSLTGARRAGEFWSLRERWGRDSRRRRGALSYRDRALQ